jgi:hypothetical protein
MIGRRWACDVDIQEAVGTIIATLLCVLMNVWGRRFPGPLGPAPPRLTSPLGLSFSARGPVPKRGLQVILPVSVQAEDSRSNLFGHWVGHPQCSARRAERSGTAPAADKARYSVT